jgi:magnesium-transporting ATPase (P-type)
LWHARAEADVLRTLDTTAEGLSSEEARSRQVRYGPNRLPVTKGPSAFALLAEQVTSPLMYALVASAAVAFAFGEVEDGVVVLAVVILNSLIGFGQEYRAGQAIAALSTLIAEPAHVRRATEWVELPAEELVPGDMVAVTEGERITATYGCSRPRG